MTTDASYIIKLRVFALQESILPPGGDIIPIQNAHFSLKDPDSVHLIQ